MNISDWFSNRCVTAFDDVAEQILGGSAQSIANLIKSNPAKVEENFRAVLGNSYISQIASKFETVQETKLSKLTVKSATPVNCKEYNKYLIDYLKKLPGVNKTQNLLFSLEDENAFFFFLFAINFLSNLQNNKKYI
ncbi:replication protein A 70 kDa DNA-binding subunit-like [Glossina fuscipes fuscipes]